MSESNHREWSTLSRRSFLARVSATAFITATHGPFLTACPGRVDLPAPEPDADARIRHLTLHTAVPLDRMTRFYRDALGLPVKTERKRITVQAGTSRITFVPSPDEDGPEPFYHVAFNIPENKHDASKAWLRGARIPIHAVHHFSHWNAHAVFFLDPALNLLEFIARHDLKNAASGKFAPERDVLCTSEIAFIVDDVPAFASEMKKAMKLGDYRPGNTQYAAPGDEHGLLLVFREGRRWHKPAATHPATVTIAGKEPRKFEPEGYPYEIRTIGGG